MTLFTAHMPFLKLLTFTRQPWDKRWRHNGYTLNLERRESQPPKSRNRRAPLVGCSVVLCISGYPTRGQVACGLSLPESDCVSRQR